MVKIVCNSIVSYSFFLKSQSSRPMEFALTEIVSMELSRKTPDLSNLNVKLTVHSIGPEAMEKPGDQPIGDYHSQTLICMHYTLRPMEQVTAADIYRTVEKTVERLQATVSAVYGGQGKIPIIPMVPDEELIERTKSALKDLYKSS